MDEGCIKRRRPWERTKAARAHIAYGNKTLTSGFSTVTRTWTGISTVPAPHFHSPKSNGTARANKYLTRKNIGNPFMKAV